MKTVLGIVGFIIGVFFFVFIIKRINFVFTNFFTLGMIFTVCVTLGVIAAYLLGWVILALAAVLAIYWIYKKVTTKNESVDESDTESQEKPN